MTRIAIMLAFVALLGSCKKNKSAEEDPIVDFRTDWKTLLDLREVMCRCTDAVCAKTTLARLTTWQSTGAKRDYTPSDVQTKDMAGVTQEINSCMITAMRAVDAPPPPPPAPPAKPTLPPTPSGAATVDELISLARGFAPVLHPQLVISSIDAVYVDADGKLDEEDGELGLLLGPANATDDPKRRIGAPAKKGPPPPSECFKLTWKRGWSSAPSACIEAGRDFGRCSISEVWKRAIAKGAPAEAVATMQLREEKPRRWTFTILDAPRKISVEHSFPDDCALTLERQ